MPTAEQIQAALSRVSDELSLARELLKNTLQWPIPDNSDSLEDISFEWSTEELTGAGLDGHFANNNIWQLQPLVDGQPWGVFILQFNNAQVF